MCHYAGKCGSEEIRILTYFAQCYAQLTVTLRKIPKFHLIYWCGNFVERHSFHRVSSKSPETLQKLCLSTKFLHQKIRWNLDILRSVTFWNNSALIKFDDQNIVTIFICYCSMLWYFRYFRSNLIRRWLNICKNWKLLCLESLGSQ